MEKRLLLAMVLSILVLLLFQFLFIKPPRPQVGSQMSKEEPIPEEKPGEMKSFEAIPSIIIPEALVGEEEKEITVTTSLYTAKWKNRGAVLTSWRLNRYLDETNQPLEVVSSLAELLKVYPLSLRLEDKSLENVANQAIYRESKDSLSLADGEKGELKFYYSDGKSVYIIKTFIFRGGSYDFEVEISLYKDGRQVDFLVIWGPGIGYHQLPGGKIGSLESGGVAFYWPPKVLRLAEKKLKEQKVEYTSLLWAAYEDNYTAALFLFPENQGRAHFFKESIALPETGQTISGYFLGTNPPKIIRIGPKEIDSLKSFGYETKKLINFGFFGAIVEVLLLGLKAFYRFIPNWGVAIILMTLVVKIIFFPLTYSSTKSMAKMQELQPKIKALQAKYKKARRDLEERRKLNEEMMRLYKEHGINPAAGCLPILIQLPVFIAFYRLLVIAIELRRSPFILWIKDLSSRDPYYILPILMGITQYISQKMVPTSADPTQRRLTLIMPIFMTIIFINFQSGLVLYWLTNNVLQIIQQYLMNRLMRRKKSQVHGKKSKK
ncbi:MAG: membrane protein insertase YidC [Candidatus Aminicenantes bacterium]|nr:membrane protein insertase YidC [Candidatus Aminicenantes bacterium]